MFSLNHFFQRSSSSGSAPNKTNSPKHLEQGFITRGRSISWKKEKNCHLEAIISVSLSSCKLNLPTCLIRPLLVARLFDLSIRRSDAKWFLGRGKFTVWPSSSNKRSLRAILFGDPRKSLRKATSLFSMLVQEYFVVAGLTNALKISSDGSNRKDFQQLVGPKIKMLLFLCLPFIRAFLMVQVKKYWLILLFLKIFFAHLSQCFSLHVSAQSEFSVPLITCILVLRDRSNLRLAPCILHVVSIRSARAFGVLIKTKLCKSGSPSCARAHAKLKNSSSVFIPCLTMRLLTSTFVRRTGLAGALDTQMFSSNFLFLTWHLAEPFESFFCLWGSFLTVQHCRNVFLF